MKKLIVVYLIVEMFFITGCATSKPTLKKVKQDWFLEHLYDRQRYLCYMKVDQDGWFAASTNNLLQLKELINTSDQEIIIPLFPTVYSPSNGDRLYYNTILESDIGRGDKVLVVGAGSGSDVWVAWLKSQALIYVIEVNPMAVANTYATARLGKFQVKPILGDIRDVDLPKDFSNFDFVLWNMPFLEEDIIEEREYHDGDDGSILRSFLTLLPSLLKKDGQAIILNTKEAIRFINLPNVTTKTDGNATVYIISNKK